MKIFLIRKIVERWSFWLESLELDLKMQMFASALLYSLYSIRHAPDPENLNQWNQKNEFSKFTGQKLLGWSSIWSNEKFGNVLRS